MAPLRVLTAVAVPFEALDGASVARWRELHEAREEGASPFLHPEYVGAVAAVRKDVEVCVLLRRGEPVGFVPMQRGPFGVGGPVGGRLCDHSGAIVEPGAPWSPRQVAEQVGLGALQLRHAEVSESLRIEPALGTTCEAAHLDLSRGYGGYRASIRQSGSSFMSQLERRARKIEAEVGPLRMVWSSDDDHVLAALLEWKARQRVRTRTPNVLDLAWARGLIERLRRARGDGFGGVLSALYAGDTLVAAHFGIRTRRVLHYWIPAFNVEVSQYSPGLLALLALAREAVERGIVRIDLGVGDERYKARAASGARPVVSAVVSGGGTVGTLVGAVHGLRQWSRRTNLDVAVRASGRALLRASYTVRGALSPLRRITSGWRL